MLTHAVSRLLLLSLQLLLWARDARAGVGGGELMRIAVILNGELRLRDSAHLSLLREYLAGVDHVFVVTYPEYHVVAAALTTEERNIRYICRPNRTSHDHTLRHITPDSMQFWSLEVGVNAFARRWLDLGVHMVVRIRTDMNFAWMRDASGSTFPLTRLASPPQNHITADSDRLFGAHTRTFITAYKDIMKYSILVYHRSRVRVVPGSALAEKMASYVRLPNAVAMNKWSGAVLVPPAAKIGGCMISNNTEVPWHRDGTLGADIQPEFAFGFHRFEGIAA